MTTPSVYSTSGNKTISVLASPPYYYKNQSAVVERGKEWKAQETNDDYVDCTRIILDKAEREHRQLQFEYLYWPR